MIVVSLKWDLTIECAPSKQQFLNIAGLKKEMVILPTFHRRKSPSKFFPKTNSDLHVNQIIDVTCFPVLILHSSQRKWNFKCLKNLIFFIWREQKWLQYLETCISRGIKRKSCVDWEIKPPWRSFGNAYYEIAKLVYAEQICAHFTRVQSVSASFVRIVSITDICKSTIWRIICIFTILNNVP